jgi:hypothetical protein
LYPRPVANGEDWFHVGNVVLEFGCALVDEESKYGDPETALFKNVVPDTAVNGIVEGVNALL